MPDSADQAMKQEDGNAATGNVGCGPATSEIKPVKSVERLFPFVLRMRLLVVGRDALRRCRGKLHFVLITEGLSENSREQILRDFAHYPVVQHYTEADLEKFFRLRGTKVIGFAKSTLAQSIYAELKQHRINKPVPQQAPAPAAEPLAPPPADVPPTPIGPAFGK